MNLEELLTESNKVSKEAKSLLQFTQIENELKKYGSVNLIGSYIYNVMLKRDVDFHIVVKKLKVELIKNFLNYLVDTELYEEIIFHDKHKFNDVAASRYVSKKALDSYYFGLRIKYKTNDWQIGVNFITQPQQGAVEIGELFKKCSENQRIKILSFKNYLQDNNVKVSSAYVYRAVLEKRIEDEKELLKYLSSLGYSV